MGNRAQNKIESHQILLSNVLRNEAKRNAENEHGIAKGSRWNGLLVPRTRA